METCTIRLANAGHQPPLYHHSDGHFEELPAEAPPIGIMPGAEFPVSTISMPGSSLYIFTDGVTESLDAQNKQLDVAGLIELIKSSSKVTARERLEGIIAEIRRPHTSQRDDITLLLIDCKTK